MSGKLTGCRSASSCWGLALFTTILFKTICVTKATNLNALITLAAKGIQWIVSWIVKSLITFIRFSSQLNVKKYRGLPKKGVPHKKWLTWIIMDINKKNVNKSNVFVFA